MINVCHQCGLYRADKIIDPAGPVAICPECGFRHPFVYLPLLVVGGASGAGKSEVCRRLLGQVTQAVLLDSDILWRAEYNAPENHYREYFETWLRVCKNITQSGRPVVLFGAGCGVPENLEDCIERRYFASVHYLALVCSDVALEQRLRQRPAWRGNRDAAYIEKHRRFNQWFKDYSSDQQPSITRIDTTQASIDEAAAQVRGWIEQNLQVLLSALEMSSASLLDLLGLLADAGIETWLDGGWGVDALIGRQTRDHDDLDLALAAADLAAFEAAVGREGFREAYRDGDFNPVYADPAGRRVDVHLVDTTCETRDGKGVRVYGGQGLPYEVGALEGSGEILGTRVPCCTVEFQVRSHTGYEFDAQDGRDMAALCDHFGIALPPEYHGLAPP